MARLLVTQSLLSDFAWMFKKDDGYADFLRTLRREQKPQTAAMLAAARWCATAALARDESRGMHQRTDRPEMHAGPAHRLTLGGLDRVWTRPHPVPGHAVAATSFPA